jgi:predicted RNA-binding Zn ribbon-like protein
MPDMTESSGDLLLLGGHRALDFLNTWRRPGVEIETLVDGAAFGRWLVGVNLLEAAEFARLKRRFGETALDAAAGEARRFREWARGWLERWRRAPHAAYLRDVETLNRMLAREDRNRELAPGSGGLYLREVPSFANAAALLSLPAGDIADLVTREDPTLIRDCAGGDCTLWFLDRTKSHGRRYCSAAGCGNRAKVAAFRERQRG